MSELPTAWAETSLGELIELKYGKALPDRERSGDGFPVFGSNGIVGHHNKALTTGATVVIGRKGSVGEVNFSEIPCSSIDTTYYVDSFPGSQSKYWYYKLRSLPLKELNKSTAIPGVSRSDVYPLKITLAPLPEQKRIADKLDSVLARVDACRDRLDRLPALLKRFRLSILAAATSGRLTEDWRPNHGIRVPTWKETTLSGACRKITDGEHITPQIFDSGVPLVSAKDVREWGVDFSDTKFVSVQFAEISRKRCDPECKDVLVVSRGATVGRTCLVASDKVFCLMGSVLLFKPNTATVIPEYFAHLLSSPSGLEQLTKASGATAQQAIYIRDAKNLPIQLPPLPEQTEIVRRVELLFAFADRLEARLAAARRQVGQLTPALLAKAFRGELVAQDPADEPAAELLKRLAAQREAAPKAKRGRAKA